MSFRSTHALRAFAVCALGTTVAQATNVPINSEQRAAAAAMTYFRLGDMVPLQLTILANGARDFTERTLRLLEAGYTPAAVRRARNGVTVACPVSGSFTAKLARNSGVVDIEWNACTIDISGRQHILTGPGRVDLCGDDFTPATVSDLRVGDGARDLVEHFVILGVPSGPENETRRNVRLAGLIPFGRATVFDSFDGNFSYSLNGKWQNVSTSPPEGVFTKSESRFDAQNAQVSGAFSYGDLGYEEDVRFNSGTFTYWNRISPYGEQASREGTSRIQAQGLRVRKVGDYLLGTDTLQVTGSVNHTWPSYEGFSCSNGGYTFKTVVPLRHPQEFMSGAKSFDAGEVLMNGSASMRFSANPNPQEIGEMHIDLGVPGVGSFGYDGNSVGETALGAAGQCSN